MTRAEVEAVIRREFPDTSPSIRLNETGGFIGLGAVEEGFNSEFIGISITNGRVIGKDYHPD